jgi:uncharacterized protein (DUF2141 family)
MVALASVLAVSASQVAQAAQVTVDVENVRAAKGRIRVAVCTQATFLGDACPFKASAPATVGETIVVLPDVPPGSYAIQLFQDEHDDGTVHRGLFGIPTEGIGFSNDAPLHLKGPKFNEAAFEVGAQSVELHVHLRRLMH